MEGKKEARKERKKRQKRQVSITLNCWLKSILVGISGKQFYQQVTL